MKKSLLPIAAILVAGSISLPSMANTKAMQNQLFQLQSAQDNNQKQFDHINGEIKKVEGQLEKLNDMIESQLHQLQANNNKMMKELQEGYEAQLKEMHDQLNDLKARLANKPATEHVS